MKFKLLLVAFLLSPVFFFAQKAINATTTISGTIEGGNYSKISILNAITGEKLQKADVKNNKFDFNLNLKKENIYALVLDRQNYLILDIKPGEKINIDYNIKKIYKTKITGSEGSEFYWNTFSKLKKLPKSKQNIFLDSVVNANPGKLATVIFAMYLDYTTYAKTHKRLLKSLKNFSDNKFVMEYKKSYEAAQKTGIGAVAPEIALADTSGKIVKRSSLKGQYVLVDFWASWCRPCRGESPNLVKAYKKYHKKGFTIYSVSLDKDKASWLKAINKDHLQSWTHVSDLKGWKSQGAADYGIRSIPANFLLDKNGKIIAKNLRGQALDKKLSEIFNK